MTRAIGFLGTGLMGAPMVRRLLGAGFAVTVWNRDASKAEVLAVDGALVAATAAETAQGAEVLFTMLSDGTAVGDVLFGQGAAGSQQSGAVVVDTSSIAPALARAHARKLAERGIAHLDAPVSGGTAAPPR